MPPRRSRSNEEASGDTDFTDTDIEELLRRNCRTTAEKDKYIESLKDCIRKREKFHAIEKQNLEDRLADSDRLVKAKEVELIQITHERKALKETLHRNKELLNTSHRKLKDISSKIQDLQTISGTSGGAS